MPGTSRTNAACSQLGFERWISIVGKDQRGELLNQEVRIILDAPLLSLTDAAFLVEMEQWDAGGNL